MASCFVIMPITTPATAVERYGGDPEHFAHVLDHLFTPALADAGFDVIRPSAAGADLIQAEIVRHLETAELVLCDISTLNANVFFELGIRVALDRPISLVRDSHADPMPFDTTMINYHTYEWKMVPWLLQNQITLLASHIRASADGSKGRNPLWRYFGITRRGEAAGIDDPTSAKLDLVLAELRSRPAQQPAEPVPASNPAMPTPSGVTADFLAGANAIANEVLAKLSVGSVDGTNVVLDLGPYTLGNDRLDRIRALGAAHGYSVRLVGRYVDETEGASVPAPGGRPEE